MSSATEYAVSSHGTARDRWMVESDAQSSGIEDLYQVVESTRKENAEVRNKN